MRISPESGETTGVGDTGGRPLVLHMARDGRLLICDSPRGLLAMDTSTGELEILVAEVDGRPLRFCSNVTETADGTIYFTESTSAFTYADMLAPILEARGRGSLFRRDPDGTVLTLVPGLYFANGLTLTADGSALVFAELQARRLSKYWLTGPTAGSVTPLAESLPGMPDNLSTGADGRIWCALFTPANPIADRLAKGSPLVRKLLGGCRHGCSPRRNRSSGRSRSTPTPGTRSRVCGPSTPSSAKSPVWSRRTASCGWPRFKVPPSRTSHFLMRDRRFADRLPG